MARGLFRKTSFTKMVGAYRSQWKRFWMRLLTFGMYGRKGMGWWRDPKKAWYNRWYHRTSISIPRLLGYRPSRASFFCAMLVASVISIFAAPVDATRAGVKAHKIRAERKARSESGGTRASDSTKANSGSTNRTTSTASFTATGSTSSSESRTKSTSNPSRVYSASTAGSSSSTVKPKNATTPKPKAIQTPIVKPIQEEKSKPEHTYSPSLFKDAYEEPITPIAPTEPENKEPDENTPKSKPKHDGDRYIRKRMIIAGASYCDRSALDKLTIGTYFELVAEPTNPHDKDAVMLVHDGEKIGYVAKQDGLPFVTCLKLKRRVYGVITDIITEPYPTKYEFETWFDSERK